MKNTKKTTKSVLTTVTLADVSNRPLTKRQREEISSLAALPDDKIDTRDIPEIFATTGWVRNPFYRPVTRSITIRLNAPDIAVARALSKKKGMPYQTYIKQLLHHALERELSTLRTQET